MDSDQRVHIRSSLEMLAIALWVNAGANLAVALGIIVAVVAR